VSVYYTKLFSSLTESTVWVGTPAETKVVWITLLAKADRYGRVWGSIPGLARLADVSIPDCQAALESFMQPDPYSRTKDHEGRRIEEIEGGWKLLNYEEKRELEDEEHKRAKNRERQRRWREKQKSGNAENNANNVTVTKDNDIKEKKQKSIINTLVGFDLFWKNYPKKVKKKQARAIWVRRNLEDIWQRIADDVTLRLSQDRRWREGFIPDPTTYLNGDRWEDDVEVLNETVKRMCTGANRVAAANTAGSPGKGNLF